MKLSSRRASDDCDVVAATSLDLNGLASFIDNAFRALLDDQTRQLYCHSIVSSPVQCPSSKAQSHHRISLVRRSSVTEKLKNSNSSDFMVVTSYRYDTIEEFNVD